MNTQEFLDALAAPWDDPWALAVTAVGLTSAAPVRVEGKTEGGVVFLLALGDDAASITVGPGRLIVEFKPSATASLPCARGLTIDRDGAEIVAVFRRLLYMIRA